MKEKVNIILAILLVILICIPIVLAFVKVINDLNNNDTSVNENNVEFVQMTTLADGTVTIKGTNTNKSDVCLLVLTKRIEDGGTYALKTGLNDIENCYIKLCGSTFSEEENNNSTSTEDSTLTFVENDIYPLDLYVYFCIESGAKVDVTFKPGIEALESED